MKMITQDGQIIIATQRSSCKSEFAVELLSSFGASGGLDSVLTLIQHPEVNTKQLNILIAFIEVNHELFHKSFVDTFYDKLS
jgi:hypothetical protein